jgi:hypothetical protein
MEDAMVEKDKSSRESIAFNSVEVRDGWMV